MSHPDPKFDHENVRVEDSKFAPKLKDKKKHMASKMKPLGEDMHRTFKKLGKAVGKFKKYQNYQKDIAF